MGPEMTDCLTDHFTHELLLSQSDSFNKYDNKFLFFIFFKQLPTS